MPTVWNFYFDCTNEQRFDLQIKNNESKSQVTLIVLFLSPLFPFFSCSRLQCGRCLCFRMKNSCLCLTLFKCLLQFRNSLNHKRFGSVHGNTIFTARNKGKILFREIRWIDENDFFLAIWSRASEVFDACQSPCSCTCILWILNYKYLYFFRE